MTSKWTQASPRCSSAPICAPPPPPTHLLNRIQHQRQGASSTMPLADLRLQFASTCEKGVLNIAASKYPSSSKYLWKEVPIPEPVSQPLRTMLRRTFFTVHFKNMLCVGADTPESYLLSTECQPCYCAVRPPPPRPSPSQGRRPPTTPWGTVTK